MSGNKNLVGIAGITISLFCGYSAQAVESIYGCHAFLVLSRADAPSTAPVYRLTAGHCLPWVPRGGLPLSDRRALFAQNPTDDGAPLPWNEMGNKRDLAILATGLSRAGVEARGQALLILPSRGDAPQDLVTFNADFSEVALDAGSIERPLAGFNQIETRAPIREGASGGPVFSKSSGKVFGIVSASDFDAHILATSLEGLSECFDSSGAYDARLPGCPVIRFR